MASTYPLEVVEAARWQKANSTLKDKALEDALEKQSWDPSVKSLATVPQVLTMMNEKLDWTTKLGDAFLASQEDVLKTVQSLRKKAEDAGNLKSSKEMTVTKAAENNVQIIKIEQPDPQTVYVPTYNPATVYGSWWYPYPPPYYYYPPGYAYGGAGLAFASGVFWGAAIAGGIGWGNNEININRNTNINTGNRNNIQGGNKWQHNPEHRKGAQYRDSATQDKFGRGQNSNQVQSREQFRGRAEQGRQDIAAGGATRDLAGNQLGGNNASNRVGGGQAGSGNRAGQQPAGGNRAGGGASAGTRPSTGGGAAAGTRPSTGSSTSGRGSGAFGGTSSGSSARSAGQRGYSSRSAGGMSRGGGFSGGGFSGGRGGGGRR